MKFQISRPNSLALSSLAAELRPTETPKKKDLRDSTFPKQHSGDVLGTSKGRSSHL